jgi:hypothetical protein
MLEGNRHVRMKNALDERLEVLLGDLTILIELWDFHQTSIIL